MLALLSFDSVGSCCFLEHVLFASKTESTLPLTQNGVFCAAGFAFSMGKQPFEQGLFGTVTVQGKQSCVHMHPYLPPAIMPPPGTLLPVYL
jgi:hypothetical protein